MSLHSLPVSRPHLSVWLHRASHVAYTLWSCWDPRPSSGEPSLEIWGALCLSINFCVTARGELSCPLAAPRDTNESLRKDLFVPFGTDMVSVQHVLGSCATSQHRGQALPACLPT